MTDTTSPRSTTATRRSARTVVRAAVATTAAVVLSCAGALAAAAHAGEHGEAPAHGHILVLGVELGDEGLTFRSCVDVAAGTSLPLRAHHDHFHHGTAGQALEAAGNHVVPTAPLSEWADCAEFETTFRP